MEDFRNMRKPVLIEKATELQNELENLKNDFAVLTLSEKNKTKEIQSYMNRMDSLNAKMCTTEKEHEEKILKKDELLQTLKEQIKTCEEEIAKLHDMKRVCDITTETNTSLKNFINCQFDIKTLEERLREAETNNVSLRSKVEAYERILFENSNLIRGYNLAQELRGQNENEMVR